MRKRNVVRSIFLFSSLISYSFLSYAFIDEQQAQKQGYQVATLAGVVFGALSLISKSSLV